MSGKLVIMIELAVDARYVLSRKGGEQYGKGESQDVKGKDHEGKDR